jgi:hypothetical protein
MTGIGIPANLKTLDALFLLTLFLYPFSAASHTLYMIPQFLLLALGLILLPRWAAPNASLMKAAVCGLAIVSASTAIFRELAADRPEFLEPVKLFINLSTVLLFLFLRPSLDSSTCAKWLKRFAVVWLVIVAGAYIHARTSSWEMLLLLLQPEGVTSTRLYEIAEPLAPIFLTKNIMAMYLVAVFGAFLYFRRRAGDAVTLLERALFLILIVLLFSRQGILSAVLLLSLDYFLTRERKMKRWVFIGLIITVVIVGSFITFAFDFSNPADGAATRLDLWRVFFTHWTSYAFVGQGVHQMNLSLQHLDIDNYHMFFMNQIGAYGIVHCVAFNALLTIIALRSLPKKSRWLVIAPYWLNVCFQTYGYEYGNLFLFCIAANGCNLGVDQVSELSKSRVYRLDDPLRVN